MTRLMQEQQHDPVTGRAVRAAHALRWAACLLLVASHSAAAAGHPSRRPIQQFTDTSKPQEPQAAQPERAPEPSAAPSAPEGGLAPRPVPVVLQVTWRVADLAAGSVRVSEWVGAHHGFSVAINEHHLSVWLPAAETPAFLSQFASHQANLPSIDAASPLWITVSLELVAAP